MLATAIIVFREAIEAGLIVGIVLAATRGVPGRVRQVTAGVAAGVAGACVVAMFAGSIAELFDEAGQEIFNAAISCFSFSRITASHSNPAALGKILGWRPLDRLRYAAIGSAHPAETLLWFRARSSTTPANRTFKRSAAKTT